MAAVSEAVLVREGLRARGVVEVAKSTLITRSASETRVASAQACCRCYVRCHGRSFVAAVNGGRALRAGGVVDVANGALITGAPREPRTASTLARCLVSIRCHVSGFVAAVNGGRALRAGRVVNVAGSASVATGAFETRLA